MSQLEDCLENYGVVLYAYVLLRNHYHLLVRTPRANLSRFMQRLNTSYALYSRYKQRKPGHRLEGRYKAKLVQGDEYILTLTRYIHLNPVKIKAFRGKGKPEIRRCLEAWRWSSYGGYRDGRLSEAFVCYDVLKGFDENPRVARRRYKAYVQQCLVAEDRELRRLLECSSHGIGDEEYVESLEAELRERKSGLDRDRDVSYPVERISFDRIDAVVAREFGVEVEGLSAHGRCKGVGVAKMAGIELACRLSGMTQREIGEHYGGMSSQAVSKSRKRAKLMIPPDTVTRLAKRIREPSQDS